MPIYEFWCADCQERVSLFYRSMRQASHDLPSCPYCNGVKLQRLVSRVNAPKSETQRLEDLASPSLMAGLSQEDPRALAHFMRRMSAEANDPLDEEMTEAVERWESGEPLGPSTPGNDRATPDQSGDAVAGHDASDGATSSQNAPR